MSSLISLVQVDVYFAEVGAIFTEAELRERTFPEELQDEDLETVKYEDLDKSERIGLSDKADQKLYRLKTEFQWVDFGSPFGNDSHNYYSCPLSWELEYMGWEDIFEPYDEDIVGELINYGRTVFLNKESKDYMGYRKVNFVIGFGYECNEGYYPEWEQECYLEYLGILDFSRLSFFGFVGKQGCGR